MTRLRGYIPTMLMLVTLMFSTTAANAGIVIGGRTDAATTTSTECSETTLTGLLGELASFARTGIVIGGRLGIVIGGRTESCSTVSSVGIIIGG